MNIRCLCCGHTIQLGAPYDAFTGPLRCVVCKQLLKVRIEDGQLRSIELESKPVTATRASASTPNPH